MENKYDLVTYSEAVWWANKAKRMTRKDAENMQRLLLFRVAEVGMSSPDVMDIINGMTDRFVEEDREMRLELMAEELRRNGVMQQETIDADDPQIINALKLTLPKFKSNYDWGGPYRILVDCCDFPPGLADFVRRFARMGIYPSDDSVKDLDHSVAPTIRGTEWFDHKFSYQAIQKGIKADWPKTYYGWLNSDITTRDFMDRRDAAKLFKANLIMTVKDATTRRK